jgi:hypothetical protein
MRLLGRIFELFILATWGGGQGIYKNILRWGMRVVGNQAGRCCEKGTRHLHKDVRVAMANPTP